MFWQKKKSASAPPMPYYPSESPRPILQKAPSPHLPNGIRFANGAGHSPPSPPGSVDSSASSASSSPRTECRRDGPHVPRVGTNAPPHGVRRSSRPTSPSASSFGSRIRSSHCSISSTSTMTPVGPFFDPQGQNAHITTPPTAYVPTCSERAPPPPSPYRPTSERSRPSSSFPRPLPELKGSGDMANRLPRHSSLFPRSESVVTIHDPNVPMLNIIPATPQDSADGFSPTCGSTPRPPRSGLKEAINFEEMDEIPLEAPRQVIPPDAQFSLDVDLDFSPFLPCVDLPMPRSDSLDELPTLDDQVVSPPFESYPSLPSLSSRASLQSCASDSSMNSSSSNCSLDSFPDVEEALGSMLASLSDSSLAILPDLRKEMPSEDVSNPGLGLGLDLPGSVISTAPTAPLSPRKRPPPPLDLSKTNLDLGEKKASPCINHRVAFYRTARAAPNSPQSGVFTVSISSSSTISSVALNYPEAADGQDETTETSCRDSISLNSEASDEDLHTASIISLTPVLGDRARMIEMREEIMLPSRVETEVGVAL